MKFNALNPTEQQLYEMTLKHTGLLNDAMIDILVRKDGMIRANTYIPSQVKFNHKGEPIPSKGLSSVGYDVSLSGKFAVCKKTDKPMLIDVKNFDHNVFDIVQSDDSFILPPKTFALGYTNEYFKMPQDVIAVAVGKSTYARAGLEVIVTPIEPGWEGQVVIEMFNMTDHGIRVYSHAGISQFMFHRVPRPMVTYSDRDGKYQGQTGLTLPKV